MGIEREERYVNDKMIKMEGEVVLRIGYNEYRGTTNVKKSPHIPLDFPFHFLSATETHIPFSCILA